MMRPGLRAAGSLSAVAVAAVLLAFPAGAAAVTNSPIAQTGGMTATLPILGGGVSVTVALDPAGNISGVTVGSTSLTQAKSTPEFVKFATSDGSTKVTVRAMGSRLAISAKTTTLAELVGTEVWSADVFGTGTTTSAQYTVGDDGNGNPTVSVATPTNLPTGVTWTAATPRTGSHDGEAFASAGGTFAYQGFVKRLTVTVKVEAGEGDEPGHASLSITLSGRDRQVLTGTLAELAAAGTRSWSAYLCDGTTQVGVQYHVNADGTIGFDAATGATATHTSTDKGLLVRFDKTSVGLSVRLKGNGDGTYTLVVRGMSGYCGRSGEHKSEASSDDHHGFPDGTTQQSSWLQKSTWGGSSGDGEHSGSYSGDGEHSGSYSGSGEH